MATENIKIGLVIMASGLGKRFGGNKLMALLDGKPLIKWIIDTTENLFDKRVVVTRNIEVKAFCDSMNLPCIVHEFPGRNDTVRLGLSSLMGEVDYCFFTPGDQPLIRRESIIKMIEVAKRGEDKIVRPCFGDSVGTPVGFPSRFFDELLHLPEGKGGNIIIQKNEKYLCPVEVQNEYELMDIDTVEDLDNIKKIFMGLIPFV